MRSPIATLQQLVIPMGAKSGTSRIVMGPQVPAALSDSTMRVDAAILFYFNATEYFFIGTGEWVPAHFKQVWMGTVTNTFGRTVYQQWRPDVLEQTFGTTAFDDDTPTINFFDVTVRIGSDATLLVDGDLRVTSLQVTGSVWQTFTPQLLATVNPTLSEWSGQYAIDPVTDMVDVYVRVVMATAGSGTTYQLTLPTAVSVSMNGSSGLTYPVGTGLIRDSSSGARQPVEAMLSSFSGGPGGVGMANIALLDGTVAGAASPWAWGVNDGITLSLRYRMSD